MDHRLYEYSALPSRAAAPAGGVGALSAFAVLFVEHWDLTAGGALRHIEPRAHAGHRTYGLP